MFCGKSFRRSVSGVSINFRPGSITALPGRCLSAALDISVWDYLAHFLNISVFYLDY